MCFVDFFLCYICCVIVFFGGVDSLVVVKVVYLVFGENVFVVIVVSLSLVVREF